MDILALLQCLHPALTATTLRQLSHIARALLTMTGRVMMAGITWEPRHTTAGNEPYFQAEGQVLLNCGNDVRTLYCFLVLRANGRLEMWDTGSATQASVTPLPLQLA